MACARQKALSRKSVMTQTECLLKTEAVQVSGCRECLSLLLPSEGGGDTVCVRCEQVDGLLSLVAGLKEEVERLRAIRECEREIDCWRDSLPGLKERYWAEIPQMGVDPVPCRSRELRRNGDRALLDLAGNAPPPPPPPPPPPSQVPLHNRFEALELERPVGKDEVAGLPRRMPRVRKLTPHLKTASTKKHRRVIVVGNSLLRQGKDEAEGLESSPNAGSNPAKRVKIGGSTEHSDWGRAEHCITTRATKKERRVLVIRDSLLRGTEAPICRPDNLSREVCCLPGARVRDVRKALPQLIKPEDYYPLVVIQVGSREAATRKMRNIKKDFASRGRSLKGSGAQVVFSSVLPLGDRDPERRRRTGPVNDWQRGWCLDQGFGYFSLGQPFGKPGMWAAD
uniref:Uncharacterized protein n=1 Tax=Anas platyrhynchos platyrhynchos TaxID=8840 RepID=A0A493TS73_ANAPP